MDVRMTMSEIERQFNSEYVLIEDVETTPELEITAGRVLWHSPDRDEVYRKAMELRPKNFAVRWIGEMPKGMVLVL